MEAYVAIFIVSVFVGYILRTVVLKFVLLSILLFGLGVTVALYYDLLAINSSVVEATALKIFYNVLRTLAHDLTRTGAMIGGVIIGVMLRR